MFIDKKSKEIFIVYPFAEDVIKIPQYEYNMTPVSVDLGLKRHAVISVLQDDNTYSNITFFNSKKIQHQKKMLASRRKKLGHLKIIKTTENINKKENKINKMLAHRISRKVIDIAKLQKNPVIVMENIKNINKDCVIKRSDGKKCKSKSVKQHNKNISSWSRYLIEQDIEYKAKYEGIPVITEPAYYNSQIYSGCGHLDKKNRETQSLFKCLKCEYTINADLNATFNESKRYKIIVQELMNKNINPSKITTELLEKKFPMSFWKNYDYSKCGLYNHNRQGDENCNTIVSECSV